MADIREKLLTLLVFAALFFGVAKFTPYVLTTSKYEPNAKVSDLFPVVIKVNGVPTVVRWAEYDQDRRHEEPLRVPVGSVYQGESFTLKSDRVGELALELRTDNYTLWSTYNVRDGQIVPIMFRYSGAFIVFYALPIALLVTSLYWAIRKRQILGRSIGRASATAGLGR